MLNHNRADWRVSMDGPCIFFRSSNHNIAKVVLFTFSISVFLFLTIDITENAGADLTDPFALTARSTISIGSYSDFNAANGVSSGSGSSTDPFIIEDWWIDAPASGTGTGIYIGDVKVYFTIRNCYITDMDYGILFNTVDYGTIDHCRIKNTLYIAIYLLYSNHNVISWNDCTGNLYGMSAYDCDYNIIKYNNFNENTWCGLMVERASVYNDILNNICNLNTGGRGIGIWINGNANNNRIKNNSCIMNAETGILMSYYCDDNEVFDNLCDRNGYGIYISAWVILCVGS